MIDWMEVGFFAGVFVLGVIVSYPVWRLAQALAYRFTKHEDRELLVQLIFIPIMGALAAAWAWPHASMFADVHSQSTTTEILFMALAGSAALMISSLIGRGILGVFEFLLAAIRGS